MEAMVIRQVNYIINDPFVRELIMNKCAMRQKVWIINCYQNICSFKMQNEPLMLKIQICKFIEHAFEIFI